MFIVYESFYTNSWLSIHDFAYRGIKDGGNPSKCKVSHSQFVTRRD